MLSTGAIFLIGEITKVVLDRLNATGQLGTLTEEQAKVIIQQTADSLLTSLPSPEDLESGKAI
jgi:hypothetical protein